MNICRYTLTLSAEVHPDVLARLTALLDMWSSEVVGDHVVVTAFAEAGNGLRWTETITDKLQAWGLRMAFTLVEHGTLTTTGAVHRYAPKLGTHVQPWHHGGPWVHAAELAHDVDRFGPHDLVEHLRCHVLAEPWVAVCPPAPED